MGGRETHFNLKRTHHDGELSASIDSGAPVGAHTPPGPQVTVGSTIRHISPGGLLTTVDPTPGLQPEENFQGNVMFPYAHDCVFNNPVMINMQTPSSARALQWLRLHSIPGVEHDSSARAPPPLCYDGTRSKVIAEIRDLRRHPQLQWKLIWIHGPVGVGKSAIMQTLAESEARQAQLGATLFFPSFPFVEHSLSPPNTPPTRNDDSRIWITICYRLATNEPSYRAYVAKRIDEDPKLVEKSMKDQFKRLIDEPIGRHGLIQSSLSIWLDGLDQCCEGNSDPQEQIIRLIHDFINKYPSSPLVWIIASRPEKRLASTFKKLHPQSYIKIIPIPVRSDDACRDVRHYLRGSFDDIQNDYDTIQPLPWPDERHFNAILISISGLFLFASAVVQFVGDRRIANPMKQFTSAFSVLCSDSPDVTVKENPLVGAHRLYAQVLQSVPETQYPVAKRILGFFLLPCGFGGWARDSTSFWVLCNILGITASDAYACMDKLHSLVEIPKIGDIASPARFFHNSLAHYLTNREYSQIFWIDVKKVVADLWQCHFRALQETQISGSITPQLSAIQLAWPSTPEEEEIFRKEMWENARRVFFHHLVPCSSNPCSFGLHYDALSDFDNPSGLVQVLQNVHFRNFVDGYVFPDLPYRFLAFLDYAIHEGQPLLQKESLLQKFDTADQNYSWIDQFAISFKIQDTHLDDGGHKITFRAYTDSGLSVSMSGVDPDRRLSTRGTPGSFAELLDDLGSSERSLIPTIILGPNGGERCGILIDGSFQDGITYYVLPYKWDDR